MTSSDSNDRKRTEEKVFVSIRSTMIFCSASRYAGIQLSSLKARNGRTCTRSRLHYALCIRSQTVIKLDYIHKRVNRFKLRFISITWSSNKLYQIFLPGAAAGHESYAELSEPRIVACEDSFLDLGVHIATVTSTSTFRTTCK